jgi:phosphoglycerate dehydrogenase-like enzyme
VRVLNQIGSGFALELRTAFPDIEVIDVPSEGLVDRDVYGDLLVARHQSETASLLAQRVPWVHVIGTGVDGVPPEVLTRPTVTCARGASAVPVAEYVMLAILAMEKDIDSLWVTDKPRTWYDARLGSLQGRRLGLFGFGGIGQAVWARAAPFGMEIGAVRRRDRPSPHGVQIVQDLPHLLAWADHLVLAAPATERTRHVLDDKALSVVNHGIHIVNVARGSLIDHDALRRALDDGRVRLATLDVTEPEPLPAGHWLFSHDRVRLSPHVSWSSPEPIRLSTKHAIENIRRYLAGEPLLGIVDATEGY